MEQTPPTSKSIKSFMDKFVMKTNIAPPISGKPTFTTCKPLMDTVDKNLINMNTDHDPIYGKLHTVTNTSQLVNGPALQVVGSTNQGRLTAFVATTTVRE